MEDITSTQTQNLSSTPESPSLPSIGTMISNLGKSAKDVAAELVKTGKVFAQDDLKNARYEICKVCEFFIKDNARCSKCGCYMATKTRYVGTVCPVGKW